MSKNNPNKESKITTIIKVKKQHIIGTQKYVNPNTGEIIECVVIEKHIENDFNFHKVWLNDLMTILGMIGTKKMRVLNYLLKNLIDKENLIVVSYKEIEKELKISSRTIAQTFKILQNANFIVQVKKGVWRVNPAFLVKGNTNKRQALMIKYAEDKIKTGNREE